jgi:glycosyltransferase involved in cell wall biosynthesis
MKRMWTTPAGIVWTLVAVLLVLAIFPGGAWGQDLAFVFAAFWLGALHRKRFSVVCALVVCFVLLVLTYALHVPIANTFGEGAFVAAAVIVLTLRRRAPAGDLRVLVVSRHEVATVGGTEQYLRNFLRCAEDPANRMQVTFATFDQGLKQPPYQRTRFGMRPGGWFFRYTRRNESEVVSRRLWNLIVLGMTSIDLAAIAVSAADERDVDVIYGVGGLIAISAAILAGFVLDRPVVCHLHYDFFFARFPWPLRRAALLWFQNASSIVANGQGAIEDLLEIGYARERTGVVHNWVFPEDFDRPARTDLRRTPSEKIALFVGRLVPEKGVGLVMEAGDRLPEGIRLVIAGGGPLDEVVDRWVHKHPNALWLGEVPNNRIAELLAAADCLVWGSIDTYYLSFAAIEALVAGVPVIASIRGTNMFGPGKKTLESTLPPSVGVLCEPDTAALVSAIVDVCAWDRGPVASACRAFAAENYSPRNFDIVAGFLAKAAESERR